MQEDHLITSPHTLEQWPNQLYLTDPVIDRENREAWEKKGSVPLEQRANDEVERRLAAYQPIETDPAIDEAVRAVVKSGFVSQESLPDIPLAPEPTIEAPLESRGRRGGRRRRRN
jgi:trimethylamine--corrinoid protein Co-methyltransferase